MNTKNILITWCVLLIAGFANAQQQVSKSEAKNAAISTLYNKEDVLKRSADTEIDTVYGFTNNKSNILTFKNKERRIRE